MSLSRELQNLVLKVQQLEQTTFETPNAAGFKVITAAIAACQLREGSYETFPNIVTMQRLRDAVDEYLAVTCGGKLKGE